MVAVPADEGATFAIAVACAFKIKSESVNSIKIEKVVKKVNEDIVSDQNSQKSVNNVSDLDKLKQEDKMEKDELKKLVQEKDDTIAVKDTAIADINKKLEESAKKIADFEAKVEAEEISKLNVLKEDYKKLSKEKGVEAMSLENANKELVEALISQLKSIKTSENSEVIKGTYKKPKDKIGENMKGNDNFFVTNSDTVKDFAIFKNPFCESNKESVFFRG